MVTVLEGYKMYGPARVGGRLSLQHVRFRELWPTGQGWRRSVWPMVRGSFLGCFIGLIPGPLPVIATMVSHTVERRLDRRGAIEGVAGPEAANNAAAGGAYVPLMALGISH